MMERTVAGAAGKDVARQHYNPSLQTAAPSPVSVTLLLVIGTALVIMRLPSLVQPMGADQGLYAYVGERILHGELPYLHAWDQKPPAIHFTYAAMRALWPSDGVVAAADLVVATAVAALLFVIGRRLVAPSVGTSAALLFLLLSNPAFTRLAGVRVRAQCETFIALLVTAAIGALVARGSSTALTHAVAGLLIGLAFTFKYNAIVYVAAAAAVVWLSGTITARRALALVGGLVLPPLAFVPVFAGALQLLYRATIDYNLQYSGETYDGPWHFASYLLMFPVDRARDDALWTLGGGGCAVLLAASLWSRERLIPVIWVATACLSIAINGSRGLPQYFVQAAPALALAAAWAGWILIVAAKRHFSAPIVRVALAAALVLVVVAVWRVNQFPKMVEQTLFDARHALGRMPRDTYLDRYADERKYSARGTAEIGRFMREHSAADETVYLFGFSAAAYVYAGRASASRFFWSRPVIAGFNSDLPGYGPSGLLADLSHARPAVVALQVRDWAPDVDDSAHFFLTTPPLADWLRANYQHTDGPEGFDVWRRRQ
jgi:hypothetical protein